MSSSASVRDLVSLPPSPSSGEEKEKEKKKSIIFFWAPWHEQSKPGGQMDNVFASLANSSSQMGKDVNFFRAEAEAVPKISQKYNVTIVPTFILLSETGGVYDRIEGVEPARLTQAVREFLVNAKTKTKTTTSAEQHQSPPEEERKEFEKQRLEKRLDGLVNSSEVMLFMKGSPTSPRCGFSRQAVELLDNAGIAFGSFDILDPNEQNVREGLKLKFDWPTYPQIYVRGELVGGLDILKDMAEEGEGDLSEQLGVAKEENINERLSKLVKRSRIMLFMKGLPSSPRCGFSRQMVQLLEKEGVAFDAFDILEDEVVRQKLKEYSDWPTYPQLYLNGDLVGGLDIVKEMAEGGELSDLLKGS